MLAYVGNVNGNRLLLLDLRGEDTVSSTDLAEVSEQLCATGCIDDLLAIEHSQAATAAIRVIGADRREADFCGDGFLFVLHVLFEKMRRAGQKEAALCIETKHGIKSGFRHEDGSVSAVIGAVENRDAEVTASARKAIEACGLVYEGFRVVGEPHLVVSCPAGSAMQNIDQSQFERLAQQLTPLVAHEGGVNVTLILSDGTDSARIRTFERGVKRMTRACGSGAVATATLIFEHHGSKTDFKIVSPGGFHLVSTDPHGETWRLTAEKILLEATQNFQFDVFDPTGVTPRLLEFVLA